MKGVHDTLSTQKYQVEQPGKTIKRQCSENYLFDNFDKQRQSIYLHQFDYLRGILNFGCCQRVISINRKKILTPLQFIIQCRQNINNRLNWI